MGRFGSFAVALFVSATGTLAATSAPPAEVANLEVSISGNDVVLGWSPVSADLAGMPTTVTNYHVYAGPTPDYIPDRAGGTNRIGMPSVTSQIHPNAVQLPGDFYYLISAVDDAAVEGNTQPSAVRDTFIESVSYDGPSAMATLGWLEAQPANQVSGYVLLSGSASRTYDTRQDLGPQLSGTAALADPDASYFFSVLAIDLEGNFSPLSNEISFELQGAGGQPPSLAATISPTSTIFGWHNTDVTVSYSCDAGITCPSPIVVTTEGADQVVRGTATDGTSATSVELFLSIDKTPPTILLSPVPAPNGNGWNNTPVTVVVFCDDALSGVDFCTPNAFVDSEGPGQVVNAMASDLAGNGIADSTTLNLDLTPPALSVTFPQDGVVLDVPQATVLSTATDTNLLAVECDGQAAVEAGTTYVCELDLLEGNNPVAVAAIDIADNVTTEIVDITVDYNPPTITVTSPVNGTVTADASITVGGTVERAAGVFVNGLPLAVSAGTFTGEVPLIEGTNTLVFTAESAAGVTDSDTLIVRRDTGPPLVVIETPGDGARVVIDAIAIAGTVNDVIPGATVNADDVVVTLNHVEAAVTGIPAEVNNRTFFVPEAAPSDPDPKLVLLPGINTIEAVAVDLAGNTASDTIQIELKPDLLGVHFVIVGGNGQSAPVGATLQPLTVRLEDAAGNPLPDRAAEFEVSNGDGLLGDPADRLRRATLLTDANGLASVDFTLGSRTGMGFHRVLVTTAGSLTFIEFCATGLNTQPINVAVTGMPPPRAVVGQEANPPLSVIVTDDGGNPVPGVDVTFQIEKGGGSFGGASSIVATTNPDGAAMATWTLGPIAGTENNEASATFAGNPGLPATFVASAVETGPVFETTISGVVLNSAGEPIPGVRAVLGDFEPPIEALTGADGRFVLTDLEPGGHHVIVRGSEANDPANDIFFPDIAFAVEAFAGVENRLDPPVIVLPFLDSGAGQLAGGAQDVVLQMSDVPGFSIRILAFSTHVPDPLTGELVQQPVMMSSSQVKIDKVPMPPPQGSTPLIVGTLQPGGVFFNPPARVTYPNIEGLPPGDVADVFAFHHDIGEFVNIGPATASEDGSVVVSDPGFGLLQSGWHCTGRRPGPAGICLNCNTDCDDGNACTDDRCVLGGCVNTPRDCDDGNTCTSDSCDSVSGCINDAIPGSCDDGDPCTLDDACVGGTCTGSPLNCPDDGDACTVDECQGGVCVNDPLDCDDVNDCTADSCDSLTGCLNDPLTGTNCDDGNPCTESDTCQAGICFGTAMECADDGSACTVEQCQGGTCVSDPLDCDDMDPCTTDSCDPGSGCVNQPLDCPDDGNACTVDACQGGVCVSDPLDCDDGNPCTDDSCDIVTGCINTVRTGTCDDGDGCTLNDMCVAGACQGDPVVCTDCDQCVNGACVPPTYDTVEVRYRTFIPCNALGTGWNFFIHDYHKGDNRDFSYNLGTARTIQTYKVSVDPALNAGLVGAPAGFYGESRTYGNEDRDDDGQGDDVTPCPHPCPAIGVLADEDCDWCILPGATSECTKTQRSPRLNAFPNFIRFSDSEILISLQVAAKHPCEPTAPAISAALAFRFRQECNPGTGQLGPLQFKVSGSHDGFPRHELYLNGAEVYRYDFCVTGEGALSLFGSGEKTLPSHLDIWTDVP